MIIWINGAFGSGKTTLAQALHVHYTKNHSPETNSSTQSQISTPIVPTSPKSPLIFDPELIGSFLRSMHIASAPEDYQDSSLWRNLVGTVLRQIQIHYPSNIIIVPMTMVNPEYLTEIFTQITTNTPLTSPAHAFVHIWLSVSAQTLRSRIAQQSFLLDNPAGDAEVAHWRTAQIARCLAAEKHLPWETHYIAGELTPEEVLHSVLEILEDYAKVSPD